MAILKTYCLQVRKLAILADCRNCARQVTSLDTSVIPGRDPRESRPRET
jgi:hypothetical protein